MRRVVELDALRGLAAVAILVYHVEPRAMSFGWPRVDLFLVLSGYLLTTIVLAHGGSRRFLPVFLARRALRIWPVYFLALAALVTVNPLLSKPFPMDGLAYYLTFTQNLPLYWSKSAPPFHWYFAHTWSLAVEEQFCAVWPALVLLAGRRHLPMVAVGLVAVSFAARLSGFHPWLLLARCDGFALGGVLAVLLGDRKRSARGELALRSAFWGVGLVTLAGLLAASVVLGGNRLSRPVPVWPGPTILATCLLYTSIVGLIASHAGHPALAPLRWRPLRFLGTISYGLYIYHSLVFVAVLEAGRRLGVPKSPIVGGVMVLATLGVACLSWLCLERPLIGLKTRLPYTPHATTATGTAPPRSTLVSGRPRGPIVIRLRKPARHGAPVAMR